MAYIMSELAANAAKRAREIRAARSPNEQASQQELMDIAKQIPAHKIDTFATSYLDIDDTELSHIKHAAGYDSIQTNFKCLLHWCRTTEESDMRQALNDRLGKAVTEGLICEKGVDVLEKHDLSAERKKGTNCQFHIFRG